MTLEGSEKPNGGAQGYDSAKRKKALSWGREKGCRVYISAAELETAGFANHEGPIWYRVWGGKRGGVRIQLYKEP